jgi:hypothetical protein
MPRYYLSRTVSQVLVLLGSVASMLLTFLDLTPWTAIVTAVSTSVTAWTAFRSTDKKLSRYANTVNACDNVLLWWKSLSDVDKASVVHIEQLIGTCEEIFRNERQAWMSTSTATKMLAKSAAGKDDDDNDSKKSL